MGRCSLSVHSRLLAGMAVVAVFSATSGCTSPARRAAGEPAQALGVSGANNGTPSVASSGARVVLSWTATSDASAGDVFVASSGDGGRSFGPPVRVNTLAGTVRTGSEQAPRVAMTSHTVAVIWTAREHERAVIRVAASGDGGRTFGAPWRAHADNLSGTRGWPSVAIDGQDRIHAVWLDGRNADVMPQAPTGAHQHGSSGGTASEGHRSAPRQDVYRAVIDRDGRVTEAPVAASVCFCCKTAVAIRPDGAGLAAWRHVFPGGVRDIAVGAFSAPDSSAPPMIRVSEDEWQIDGCPEDGPALASAGDDTTHVTWPTLVPGQTPVKGVFYASAHGSGAFGPRERLDAGAGEVASHPQLVVAPGGDVAVVWESSSVGARRIVLRRKAVGGGWGDTDVLTDATAGTHPSVAASDGAWVVAWASETAPRSTIAVRRITR